MHLTCNFLQVPHVFPPDLHIPSFFDGTSVRGRGAKEVSAPIVTEPPRQSPESGQNSPEFAKSNRNRTRE
jgi:hypothetical protein